MTLIREIVEIAIETGKLTVASEQQLRLKLRQKNPQEELEAFVKLQQAIIKGQVQQQSRQLA